MLKGICAISENNVMGKNGKIPRHMTGDLKRFKEFTKDQIVVMGQGTYNSLKGYWPDREGYPHAKKNIVISSSLKSNENIEVIPSINEFLEKYKDDTVWVLGGGILFSQLLSHIDVLYLTIIEGYYEGDTKFPENYKEIFPNVIIEKGRDEGTRYETYYKSNISDADINI